MTIAMFTGGSMMVIARVVEDLWDGWESRLVYSPSYPLLWAGTELFLYKDRWDMVILGEEWVEL